MSCDEFLGEGLEFVSSSDFWKMSVKNSLVRLLIAGLSFEIHINNCYDGQRTSRTQKIKEKEDRDIFHLIDSPDNRYQAYFTLCGTAFCE